MNKILPAVLVVSLLFVSSCSDSDSDGNGADADREWLGNDILSDDTFPADREEAECYVDTVSTAANVSYAEMRAWGDEGPEEPSPQLFAALLGSMEPCGIEIDNMFSSD